jgi:hypothetical protein
MAAPSAVTDEYPDVLSTVTTSPGSTRRAPDSSIAPKSGGATRCDRIGSTSFTLGFTVLRSNADVDEQTAVRGRNVYVVVSTDDWAKRPIPAPLRDALTSVERQGRNGAD